MDLTQARDRGIITDPDPHSTFFWNDFYGGILDRGSLAYMKAVNVNRLSTLSKIPRI